MTVNLLDRIFEIQRKIDAVVMPKYEGFDQGMFLQQDSKVYWRDNSYWNDEVIEYSFSFSTNGECKGELPPDCAIDILAILEGYK